MPRARPAVRAPTWAGRRGWLRGHQLGEGEGEHAGEQVHADLVVGEVADRGERHHVRVLGLAEPGFEVLLGPVGVDDLLEGPVVVVGDQDPLTEDLLLQPGWAFWSIRQAGAVWRGCRRSARWR